MDVGSLGSSFAPPIQQTADLSNVAGALSLDAFDFFATKADAPITAPGVDADGIAFATARVATTTASSTTRTAWCVGRGEALIAQYLPFLLE